MSRIVPNTTQTPNVYIDRVMHLLDEAELKTLLYAVRRILGFHKEWDYISLSQFMGGNGRLDEDGEPLEYGTGLTKTTQIKVLGQLVDFGLLIEAGDNKSNSGKKWALQLDDRRIDWDALWDRYEGRKTRGRKRTRPARTAAAARQQQGDLFEGGLLDRPPDPGQGGLSNRPPGGLLDRPPVVYPIDPQKKEETKKRKPDQKEAADPDLEVTWAELLAFCEGDQETAAVMWQLMEHFRQQSKINLDFGSEYDRPELRQDWWPALHNILTMSSGNVEAARVIVTGSVAEMSAWKETAVQSPKSIVKKARAMIAAQQRGHHGPNGNGAPSGAERYAAVVSADGFGL